MSFVEQEDVFAAMEPVITRRVRGVRAEAARKPVTPKLAAHPLRRRRSRKYGTDKPDLRNPIEMQDVTEHFRGSGFKVFAGMIEKDPKVARVGDPGAGRRLARLLRPHERLGAEAKASRASATSSGARTAERRRRRARRQEPRAGASPTPIRSSSGLKDGDAVFFAAGNPAKFYKFAGEARTQDRRAS